MAANEDLTQERLKNLKEHYAVSLRRFGKYVTVEPTPYEEFHVIFAVGNRLFNLFNAGDEKDTAEFMKIMFCRALNEAAVLEFEGIDTGDSAEMDFSGARVGVFHRPRDLVQIAEWPFP